MYIKHMSLSEYLRSDFEKDVCTVDICTSISNHFKDLKNKKILDLGCGMGDKSLLLNPRNNIIEQTDVEDLRILKKHKFFLSSNNKINAKDNTYDYVVSIDVIEHIKEDKNFINEVMRVLKPKGKALITTPNKYRLGNIVEIIKTGKPIKYPKIIGYSEGLKDCIHIREYTNKSLNSLVDAKKAKDINVKNIWLGIRLNNLQKFRIKNEVPFPLNLICQSLFLEFEKI